MATSAELGEVLEQAVIELVETGRYGSKSEVLREGVRLVQEREARLKHLQRLLKEAEDDIAEGRLYDAEEVFAAVRERIRQVAERSA